MYRKVHYRVWDTDGLVCLEGETQYFSDAFDRVYAWLDEADIWDTLDRIEFKGDEDESD